MKKMKQAYIAPFTNFYQFEGETQILAGSDPEGEQTEEFGGKEHTFEEDSFPTYASWSDDK